MKQQAVAPPFAQSRSHSSTGALRGSTASPSDADQRLARIRAIALRTAGLPVVVIDTSALVAILLGEPGADELAVKLSGAQRPLFCAANWLEAMIVVAARLGPPGVPALRELLDAAEVLVAPADAELVQTAFDASQRFGKGQHPAGLNFGDRFAYALRHLPVRGRPSRREWQARSVAFSRPCHIDLSSTTGFWHAASVPPRASAPAAARVPLAQVDGIGQLAGGRQRFDVAE